MDSETGIAHSIGASAHRIARLLGRAMLDFAMPPLCLACSKPVGSPGSLCVQCWQGLDFISPPYCQRLGTPFEADLGEGLISLKAIAEPPVFGRARAVARFDGTARELVHRLKYSDRLDLAGAMGSWMVRAGAEVLIEGSVLVPIPLYRTRLWRRRFNQSGELAKVIGRAKVLEVDHQALRKVKATPSQTGLNARQRKENLAGAFKVRDEAQGRIAGRRVVLVDDVMTTGATLNAAARVLLRAGASEVDAMVFALVAERV